MDVIESITWAVNKSCPCNGASIKNSRLKAQVHFLVGNTVYMWLTVAGRDTSTGRKEFSNSALHMASFTDFSSIYFL